VCVCARALKRVCAPVYVVCVCVSVCVFGEEVCGRVKRKVRKLTVSPHPATAALHTSAYVIIRIRQHTSDRTFSSLHAAAPPVIKPE
jgi:hypothetical protein